MTLREQITGLLEREPRTVDQLVTWTSHHRSDVRTALAVLVFNDRTVTCDRDGRYTLGNPIRLINCA